MAGLTQPGRVNRAIMTRGNLMLRLLLAAALFLPAMFLSALVRAEAPLDLRIIIDISGEVRGAMPANEHLQAIDMLLDQLPAGSKAGLWTFGKYSNHLVTWGEVDSQWRELAAARLPGIRSVASWRDISRVLGDATFDRTRVADETRRIILLLSAGGIHVSDDPQFNLAAQDQVLREQIGPLREAGFEVHTIALNAGVQTAFLAALAKESNGLAFAVTHPDAVFGAVKRFADTLGPRLAVPIVDAGFAIDAKAGQFLALLPGEPSELKLVTPSGVEVSAAQVPAGFSWRSGLAHARIVAEAPELGRWRIVGDQPGGQVFIETTQDIALEPLATRYVSGEKIPVVVRVPDNSTGVTPLTVTLEATGFDGREAFSQQLAAEAGAPGLYRVTIPGFVEPDSYRLVLAVEALAYSRILAHTLQVSDLLALDVQAITTSDSTLYRLSAAAADAELDLERTELALTITDSAGELATAALKGEPGNWGFEISDDGVSSEYQLDLELIAESISGRSVSYRPRPLIITLPQREMPDVTGLGEFPGANGVDDETGLVASDKNVLDEVKRDTPAALSGKNSYSTVMLVLAVISVTVGLGLGGLYLWLRMRAPLRVDLTRDAAEYRRASNITINRVHKPGQPFQEVVAPPPPERVSRLDANGVPPVEEFLVEEAFGSDEGELEQQTGPVEIDGQTDQSELVRGNEEVQVAEESGIAAQGAEQAAEVMESDGRAISPEAVEDGQEGQRVIVNTSVDLDSERFNDALAEPEPEPGPGPEMAPEHEPEMAPEHEPEPGPDMAVETSAAVDDVQDNVEERSAEPSPVEERDVISITRLTPESALIAEDQEALPDFESVDPALEEEIAADTALIEETELATEWDNVTVLAGRTAEPDTADLVALELDGEDPFEEYRMEYEASQGQERR